MTNRSMDPDDVRPVKIRIAEALKNAYEPGTQLPTVPTIAAEWGVSNETVRAGIDILRKEGLLVSYQGRGTFYRHKPEDTSIPEPVVREFLQTVMTRLDSIEARLTTIEQATKQH